MTQTEQKREDEFSVEYIKVCLRSMNALQEDLLAALPEFDKTTVRAILQAMTVFVGTMINRRVVHCICSFLPLCVDVSRRIKESI